jgi:hypothetical protein
MSDLDNGHDPSNQSSLSPVLTLRHTTAGRQTNSQDDVTLEEQGGDTSYYANHPRIRKSQLEVGKRYRINCNWGRAYVKDFESLGRRPWLFQIKSCSGGITFFGISIHVLVPASEQTCWVFITKKRTRQHREGQSLPNYFLRNTGVPRDVNRCSVNNIEKPKNTDLLLYLAHLVAVQGTVHIRNFVGTFHFVTTGLIGLISSFF